MIALIKSRCGHNLSNTYVLSQDYSTPVYFSNAKTLKKDIDIYLYPPPKVSTIKNVPILEGATAAKGSDKHMAIVDKSDGCVYEFWSFKGKKAASGNAISMSSNGIYTDGRSTVAAGWSQLQGLIWPKELQEGVINHALSFTIPVTNKNGFVSPATSNDGALSNHPYAIPEGTLIRINPSILIDTLSNLGPIEKIVYKAIQKYGMYCGDTNGAGLGLRAVATNSLPSNAYPESYRISAGNGNYYLKHFPFDHLEVVYTGAIQSREYQDYVNHGCADWE